MMANNAPPNLVEEEEDWNTGLNCIESNVMHKLQHGQFYAHTGNSHFLTIVLFTLKMSRFREQLV